MVYIYQLFAQSRARSRTSKRGEHAVLIIRDPEPAGDPVIKAALEKAAQEGIISFDDVLGDLRRPWWRRALDKVRLFRR